MTTPATDKKDRKLTQAEFAALLFDIQKQKDALQPRFDTGELTMTKLAEERGIARTTLKSALEACGITPYKKEAPAPTPIPPAVIYDILETLIVLAAAAGETCAVDKLQAHLEPRLF